MTTCTAYYAVQIDLSLATLTGAGYTAPLVPVRLATLNLAQTPLGALAPSLVPSLVTCPAGRVRRDPGRRPERRPARGHRHGGRLPWR